MRLGSKILVVLALTGVAVTVGGAKAQQPSPSMVVVQAAAAPAASPKPAAASAAAPDAGLTNAIKVLEQVKAANDETLKKQEAALQQLDELQKAAEQLKVFAKRV